MSETRRYSKRAFAALGLMLLGLACLGRSPATHHYRMNLFAGAAVETGLDGRAVGLGPVSFPRHLERPQIVTRTGTSSLSFDANQRWAGGFESNVVRVLAGDLVQRIGVPVVTDPASTPLPVVYQVAVAIEEFEGRPGGELVLRARFVVRERGGEERVWSDLATVRLIVEGRDLGSLVSAHDAAVGGLADAIARRLADLAQSDRAR